jgi:CHASE2 domain-containing sensor protein
VNEPLRRVAGSSLPRRWWQRTPFSVASAGWGGLAIVCGLVLQFRGGHSLTDLPDPRVMLPLLAVGLLLGAIAFVRREPERLLALCGVALSTTAVVMGWFVLVSAVALVAVVIGKIVAELI